MVMRTKPVWILRVACLLLVLFQATRSNSQNVTVKTEVLTDVKVVEVDRRMLIELGVNPLGFVINLSESMAHSLAEAPRSKTLQGFQLPTTGESVAHFRVASRVTMMDVGVDFDLVSKVTAKREIAIQVASQVNIRRGDAEPTDSAVFVGHSIQQEIMTAEGANIVLGGFVTEADAGQMAKIGNLQNSPLLHYLVATDDPDESEVVVILTPHIIRAPKMTEVIAAAVSPASTPVVPVAPVTPAAPPSIPAIQNKYTVQVGAFKDQIRARGLLDKLVEHYPDAFMDNPEPGHSLYLVRVGKISDFRTAKQLEAKLRADGYQPFVSNR
jgi:cell division septation protein DedD